MALAACEKSTSWRSEAPAAAAAPASCTASSSRGSPASRTGAQAQSVPPCRARTAATERTAGSYFGPERGLLALLRGAAHSWLAPAAPLPGRCAKASSVRQALTPRTSSHPLSQQANMQCGAVSVWVETVSSNRHAAHLRALPEHTTRRSPQAPVDAAPQTPQRTGPTPPSLLPHCLA